MRSNVEGQIEPQDALDALRTALEEAARETGDDSLGDGGQAAKDRPTMDELVARMQADAERARERARLARTEVERMRAALQRGRDGGNGWLQ
jgi:hypothetical protein